MVQLCMFTCTAYNLLRHFITGVICLIMCAGEFGTVFRGVWKEQPKKQVAVAIKTLKVSTYELVVREICDVHELYKSLRLL